MAWQGEVKEVKLALREAKCEKLRPRLPYVKLAGSTNASGWFGNIDLHVGFDEVKYQHPSAFGSNA